MIEKVEDMLIPFDDYPYHQIPSTFDHAVSGDPRWFDRYWFVTYSPDGQVVLATGLGLYKNMNVLDGFASVVVDRRQRNVRVSRVLRPDFEPIGAGPLRYEIQEGLRSFRLKLDENEYGLSFDLSWIGTFPPFEEAHQFLRVGGMAQQDFVRFFQHGTVTGRVVVDGKVSETGSEKWFGFRDRSFGVRPYIGGQMPKPAPPRSSGAGQPNILNVGPPVRFSLFCGFSCADVSGVFRLGERSDGTRAHFSGHLLYPLTDGREPQKLVGAEHEFTFVPGTLRLERYSVSFKTEAGEQFRVEGERLTEPFRYEGFGYMDGFHDRQGTGAYRGDHHIEGDNYDLSDPLQTIDESGGREFKPGAGLCDYASRVTINGKPGFAEVVIHPGF